MGQSVGELVGILNGRLCDSVNDSRREQSAGSQVVAFEQSTTGLGAPQPRRQIDGTSPARDQPPLDTRVRKRGVGRRDHGIAREHQVEASSQARALDSGDCRSRVASERAERSPTEPGVGDAGVQIERGDLGQIGTCQEDPGVARGQHQGFRFVTGGEAAESRRDLSQSCDCHDR